MKIGDAVTLKGGGVVMTVSEVLGQDVGCAWHSADGILQERLLPLTALRVVDDSEIIEGSDFDWVSEPTGTRN